MKGSTDFLIGAFCGATIVWVTMAGMIWLQIRDRTALNAAYDVIERLHTRLMDPPAQARFDQHLTEREKMIESELKLMEMTEASKPQVADPEQMIAGLGMNATPYPAHVLNDIE